MIKGKKYTMEFGQFATISVALIVYIVLLLYVFTVWNQVPYGEVWYERISFIASITFLIQLALIIFKHRSIISFEAFFIILNQFFAFGRVYLLAWNKHEYIFWDLMTQYTDLEKWRAGLLAITIGFGITLGFILFNKKRTEVISGNERYTSKQQYYVGLVFFIMMEPITLYVAVQNMAAVSLAGRYADADINGVIGCLSYVATVGIIIMIASKYLTRRNMFALVLVYNVFSLVIATFTADRRYVVTAILITIIEYLYVYNIKIRPLRLITYVTGGMIVLMFINAIRTLRTTEAITFSSIVHYITTSNTSLFDTIYSSMSEFGITFFTYTEVVSYYPDLFGFKYGITYLLGPVTLIPGIGRIIPAISKLVSIPAPIEELVHYSVGGSLGEELYGNYGLFAVVFAVISGYLLSSVMRNRLNDKISGYAVAKYYISFYFFINLVRSTFNEMLRSYVWTFIIISVLFYVMCGRRKTISDENSIRNSN